MEPRLGELNGSTGNDVLMGGSDRSLLNGGAGSDVICGDVSNGVFPDAMDAISGGDGDDYLYGGCQADTAQANPAGNVIHGGPGMTCWSARSELITCFGEDGGDAQIARTRQQ